MASVSEITDKIQGIIVGMQADIEDHNVILDDAAQYLDEDKLSYMTHCLLEASQHLAEAFKCYDDAVSALNEGAEKEIKPEDLEEMAAVAQAFDESGDELLQKQASVLDDLLISLGSPSNFKKAEEEKIEKLRQKYKEMQGDAFKIYSDQKTVYKEEAAKAIDEKIKKSRPLETSLQTRYSPDMPGVSMLRITDGVYQCPVTHKVYDFNNGFVTMNGTKVPGTSTANQTKLDYQSGDSMAFATRESILNGS